MAEMRRGLKILENGKKKKKNLLAIGSRMGLTLQ